jgi:predicted nucleic acid-binding protein
MSYLVDTNVLSELRRKQPNAAVAQWFAKRPAGTLFLSVLTLGEIRKGVETLPDPRRRLVLLDWLENELPKFFAGRILAVDAAVADRWGRIVAQAGRPLTAIESLLVATAAQHDLVLVTRNPKDVRGLGVQALNPWS